MTMRTFLIVVTLLVLGVITLTQTSHAGTRSDASNPPNCPPTWYTSPSPSGPTNDDYLSGVDAVSANIAWAVGRHRMILYWDGTQWLQVAAPYSGEDYNLNRVEVITADNVWAVGASETNASVVLRWNGAAWSTVPAPDIGGINDLAAISANDVWLVSANTFMHWNGLTWTTYTPPTGGPIVGIDGAAANDVWAVTSTYYSDAMHWNGTSWTSVPVSWPPYPDATWRHFADVTVLPGGEAWIVGDWVNYAPKPLQPEFGPPLYHTFVSHWNGTVWQYVDFGNFGPYDGSALTQIDARASNDVWAVGNGPAQRILYWNGSQWIDFSTPAYNFLTGVAIADSDNVWAVGAFHLCEAYCTHGTLIRRYADPCVYPPPPTATPVPPSATPPTPTVTSTPRPPRCPGERFTDVCPGDYFYQHVLDLNDLGIVAGYNTSPPCESPAHVPCFKPYNNSTRGQISKIVSLAAGFSEPESGQTFQDVDPNQTFYEYIERIAAHGIVSGYPCGSIPTEPCVPPENKPYFRPGASVTRGQLSKMVSLAFNWNEPITGQLFQDVPPISTFYEYIGRLYNRGIINGYPCGSPSRPCIPPNNLPYFQPNNSVTRGQIAKIVNLARTLSGATVTPTSTSTSTPTSVSTSTATASSTSTASPSAIPTCCTNVTGSITASCQGPQYHVSYTITNSCPITLTANIASLFEVSPNMTGPWQTVYVGDCFSCPVPPGSSQHETNVYSGALPAGNNWWRYQLGYYGTTCGWSLTLTSDPQPACVTGTVTPVPTPSPTP